MCVPADPEPLISLAKSAHFSASVRMDGEPQ